MKNIARSSERKYDITLSLLSFFFCKFIAFGSNSGLAKAGLETFSFEGKIFRGKKVSGRPYYTIKGCKIQLHKWI